MTSRRRLAVLFVLATAGLAAAAVTRAGGPENPFAAAPFFVDPESQAAHQARIWAHSRPAASAAMRKLAAQPQADWFTQSNVALVRRDVRRRVGQIARARRLPVLVAYDIPKRDCGSYSAGGAVSPAAYRRWIRALAAGIGGRRAVVILEPDALPELECLSATERLTRLAMLSDAVDVLSSRPGVSVYLDAGHSAWRSVADMVVRLRSAGVARARGFSLNVASTWPTADQLAYGDALGRALGGKHYVVDTSRNGRGPLGDEWCNPRGRALGERPTTATGHPLADAFFWVKRPGESDGSCNGGPQAGQWWPEYALGLAQRARY